MATMISAAAWMHWLLLPMPASIPLVTGRRAAMAALMPLVEALISPAASRVDRSVVLMSATVELIDLAVALIAPAVSRAARTDDSIDFDCVSIEPDDDRIESTLPRMPWVIVFISSS